MPRPRIQKRMPSAKSVLAVSLAILGLSPVAFGARAGGQRCESVFLDRAAPAPRFQKVRPEVEQFNFDMPGMKVASLSDPTLATGATLFLFPDSATANYDARGGSVASIETSLLDESSYSNSVDGILFAGGSTMGLEATQGVRRRLFKERAAQAGQFDFIPSIPGAVVYDYAGRIEPEQNKLTYPGLSMGAALYDQAAEGRMLIGRVGAGTATSANKISNPIWGGQGARYREIELPGGTKGKIFTAVVVNAHGNISIPVGLSLNAEALESLRKAAPAKGKRTNTTLSIVVTDVALDRSQLKRLATVVHTGMAGMIRPFHSYTDGDICFAVSLQKVKLPELSREQEEQLQLVASELMNDSVLKAVTVANKRGVPPAGAIND